MIADILGSAGPPTTFVGLLLTLFFYMRKQDSVTKTDMESALTRKNKELMEKDAEVDKQKALYDEAIKENMTLRHEVVRLHGLLYRNGIDING